MRRCRPSINSHLRDPHTRIWKKDMKQYTCTDYRQEMILLSLQRRLADPTLDEHEKQHLQEQIRKLEADMGM
ncbi:MAG: hypothetical protein VR64_24700 [Desulfatitalea sp. BRH_c12]|nr:MAG: hypothetical protein VR64_24700 [Desulfatitalea sp. BRH_c12]